jgi:cyclohexanone monooxygenase
LTTHGFPNQFFTGFIQGGLNASLTATFDQQAKNIAYIIKEGLARGAATVEPSLEAQDAWVKHIRETAFDVTPFAKECTPGYFNNEGEEKFRWYLGESYGPGFYVFEKMMDEWRAKGDMAGLVLTKRSAAVSGSEYSRDTMKARR